MYLTKGIIRHLKNETLLKYEFLEGIRTCAIKKLKHRQYLEVFTRKSQLSDEARPYSRNKSVESQL